MADDGDNSWRLDQGNAIASFRSKLVHDQTMVAGVALAAV